MIGHIPGQQQFVADELGHPAHVPDLTPRARGPLHACGPRRAHGRVAGQSLAVRAAGRGRRGQLGGQDGRIFQGLAGALGEVLQHGMGRIAEQCHPALGPVPRRQPVQHRPPVVDAERGQ